MMGSQKMNMDHTYIVQCSCENFDDVKYLMNLFANVVDIDNENYSIKTFALDSLMKQRLTEIGASFWEETDSATKRSTM